MLYYITRACLYKAYLKSHVHVNVNPTLLFQTTNVTVDSFNGECRRMVGQYLSLPAMVTVSIPAQSGRVWRVLCDLNLTRLQGEVEDRLKLQDISNIVRTGFIFVRANS